MLLREVCKNILFLVMDAGRALSAPSTKAKVIIFIKKQTHTHTNQKQTQFRSSEVQRSRKCLVNLRKRPRFKKCLRREGLG